MTVSWIIKNDGATYSFVMQWGCDSSRISWIFRQMFLFLLPPVLTWTIYVPDFLREDTPVGTSFLRAAAHDDDQGTNAAITYSLSSQIPAYFHINPSTGWVYVNQPISQVCQYSHSFYVVFYIAFILFFIWLSCTIYNVLAMIELFE